MGDYTKKGVTKLRKGAKEFTMEITTDSLAKGTVPFLKTLKDTLKKEGSSGGKDYGFVECLGHNTPYIKTTLTTVHPSEFTWLMNCIKHSIQNSSGPDM